MSGDFHHQSLWPGLLLVLLSTSAAAIATGEARAAGAAGAAGAGASAPCRLAREHHDAGRFAAAAALLQGAIDAGSCMTPGDYHLLGKAYGRLAEQAPWYRALGLARKTLRSFNRAVQLDEYYLPALQDLMQFHLQAPGIVGGDADQAERLRRRIEVLQSGAAASQAASQAAGNGGDQ